MRVILSPRARRCPYFRRWLFEATVIRDCGSYAIWDHFTSQADFDSVEDAKRGALSWFKSRYGIE